MKIIEDVYVIPGVTANVYLIAGSDGLTLIDTGLPHSERAIRKYLAEQGWSAGDIKRILITHADMDHYGCLAHLQEESGARTYASPIEAEAIAEGRSSRPLDYSSNTRFQRFMLSLFSPMMKAIPFKVDETLAEGQVLPPLGGLQVVETPGHSPNHISFFAPSVGVLFCGDSMRSDNRGLHTSNSRNDWDLEKARDSVRKQARLGARIVCPGHGHVVRDAGNRFPV
jgi:glyoxylase-like metal-dependent hydrolase (beta-lactamase superfamily II)